MTERTVFIAVRRSAFLITKYLKRRIALTTGGNAINQAEVFDEAVELDGIVLTKLDSSAKGGFVISLCSELGIPVAFVGTGEKMEDLEAFSAEEFIDALI